MGEVMPFIEEILNTIQSIICDLQPQQVSCHYVTTITLNVLNLTIFGYNNIS